MTKKHPPSRRTEGVKRRGTTSVCRFLTKVGLREFPANSKAQYRAHPSIPTCSPRGPFQKAAPRCIPSPTLSSLHPPEALWAAVWGDTSPLLCIVTDDSTVVCGCQTLSKVSSSRKVSKIMKAGLPTPFSICSSIIPILRVNFSSNSILVKKQ